MKNINLLLNAKKLTLEEANILEILTQIEGQEMNLKSKKMLCSLFRETENILVANSIALIMEEFPSKEYKAELLNKYLSTSKGFRGTLLFAMTSYDYSEQVDVILDIFLESGVTDEEAMAVYDLFIMMNSDVLKRCVVKYSSNELNSEQELIINTLSEASVV